MSKELNLGLPGTPSGQSRIWTKVTTLKSSALYHLTTLSPHVLPVYILYPVCIDNIIILLLKKVNLYVVFSGTVEYEAKLKHDNEMKRLEAELRGK